MGFAEKAKNYFREEKGLSNRELAKQLGDYSEVLVSRYFKAGTAPAPTFVLKIKTHFPDAPVDDWLIGEDVSYLKESEIEYTVDPIKRINRIISELEDIKKFLKLEAAKK
jgi:transcriptional regulator with XRE-family HTH domain